MHGADGSLLDAPVHVRVFAVVLQNWADTETTTALWRAISSGDKEALETLLDTDEKNAHVRAADGRGPLWYALGAAPLRPPAQAAPTLTTGSFAVVCCRWAYEHKNEEAIELLQAAGIDENAKDRGKTPTCIAPPHTYPHTPTHTYPHTHIPAHPQRTCSCDPPHSLMLGWRACVT